MIIAVSLLSVTKEKKMKKSGSNGAVSKTTSRGSGQSKDIVAITVRHRNGIIVDTRVARPAITDKPVVVVPTVDG